MVGAALAMPGDIEEEGFCIDGDVVAGFCLGPDYSEFVQGPLCSDIYPRVSQVRMTPFSLHSFRH